MNKTISFILVLSLAMLASMLPGCSGRATRYDTRLVLADSVLKCNDPDSALRLLTAIDARQLSSAGDRAYHALLLTQAQYRSYTDIKSDSAINVALDYYKRHDNEREKLTSTYIYKGAVTEVLGDPEAAMTWYKQAVDATAPDDHFNRGYAYLRIGYLYRDHLVQDSADITNLKQALYHFRQVPDSFYIAQCLSSLGGSYMAVDKRDSARVYLEQADKLIKALHQPAIPAIDVLNQRYLADLKMFSKDIMDIEAAKDIAVSLADKDPDEHNHLLLTAAFTLAKLNKADSANYYLKQVEKDKLSDGLWVLYNDCLAELARCHGNVEQFKYYFELADQIADSLITYNKQQQLREVETRYDNEVLENRSLRYRYNWIVSLIAAALLGTILVAVIAAMRRKLSRRQRLLQESEDAIERLREDAARLTEQLDAHQAMNSGLKQAVRSQVEMYTRLVEQHATTFASMPHKFIEAFERSYSKNPPKDSFWTGIHAYANGKYNDIITRSLEEHPSLNITDLNFLSLYCCGFSTTVIMACMGYKESHSLYNKKRRVAEAVGCPGDLDAYVNLFKGFRS